MTALVSNLHLPTPVKRRAIRFPFVADAEITDLGSGCKVNARVTELSLYGCYLETSDPPATGSKILVRIFTRTEFFEAYATVVHTQLNTGLGISFSDVRPAFLGVLKGWLTDRQKRLTSSSRTR